MKALKFSALVASIFSVLFSLSLIRELYRLGTDKYITIFLGCFLTLFVIWNEISKVRELTRKFNKLPEHSFFMLLITFVISFSMSGIGVWFWTDNSLKIEESFIKQTDTKLDSITLIYNKDINQVNSESYNNDPEYLRLQNSLNFWVKRKAINEEDLIDIRSNIILNEKRINSLIENFNTAKARKIALIESQYKSNCDKIKSQDITIKKTNRNNTITYIFFILIAITEFIIVSIHNEISVRKLHPLYKEYENALKGISYLTFKFQNHEIEINDLKYSPVVDNSIEFDQIKKIWNLYFYLEAIKDNKVQENSIEKVKQYYKKVLNLTR